MNEHLAQGTKQLVVTFSGCLLEAKTGQRIWCNKNKAEPFNCSNLIANMY